MGLNTKASWVHDCLYAGSAVEAETVILHENGHVLGLGHSANVSSIMAAFYSGAQCQLHQDDIDGIAALYPAGGATATATPTATPAPTPLSTPTASPIATPTASPTATASPTVTQTASPTATATATATPTATASPTATATPMTTVTPSPTVLAETATPSATATPDGDGDGILDSTDNCPNWYNPLQDLPPWPIDTDDPDCDGFSTAKENDIGTDPSQHCGFTTGGDPSSETWPPDLVESNNINISDVLALKPVFGTSVGPTSPRFDLIPSGGINISDVLALKPVFGQSCTP